VSVTPKNWLSSSTPQANRSGKRPKTKAHGTQTPLHLAFSVHVFDDLGRALLTRRALGKRTWAGVWTNTCCGHPAPGEPIIVALHRRAEAAVKNTIWPLGWRQGSWT
jgi:isopentenyl-diphosphate Delta-isomerase